MQVQMNAGIYACRDFSRLCHLLGDRLTSQMECAAALYDVGAICVGGLGAGSVTAPDVNGGGVVLVGEQQLRRPVPACHHVLRHEVHLRAAGQALIL